MSTKTVLTPSFLKNKSEAKLALQICFSFFPINEYLSDLQEMAKDSPKWKNKHNELVKTLDLVINSSELIIKD